MLAGRSGSTAVHFVCVGAACTRTAGCGCRVHTASVRAPQLQAKGPEDAPALSLFSLLFPLPFSMSQMAILLKTSKKALHSTAHMCPGMFVDLSESQPCPRLRSCSFKSIQKSLFSPSELRASLRAQSTQLHIHRPRASPGHRALAAL